MPFAKFLSSAFALRRFGRRQFGVVGNAYAIAVAGTLAAGTMAIAVADFAVGARNAVVALEADSDKGHATIESLDTLRRAQRQLVMSSIFSADGTAKEDNRKALEAVELSLKEAVRLAPEELELPSSDDFGRLSQLADNLVASDLKLDAPEDRAAVRSYFEVSDRISLQIRGATAAQSATTRQNIKDIASLADDTAWTVGGIAMLVVLIGVPLTIVTLTRLTRRINGITNTMHRIADRDTAVEVPSTIDVDEIGDLARAVQAFKRSTIALQRNSDQITRLNGWFDLALNNMHTGLTIFDHKNRLVMCNDRYREIYELPTDLVRPGTDLATILNYWKNALVGGASGEDGQLIDVDTAVEQHRAEIEKGDEFVRVHTLQSGRMIVVSYRPSPDGGWVDVHEDVTDRIQTDETIKRLAHTDPLTGLMNRQSFMESLSRQLTARADTDEMAILLVDMQNFKSINEVCGLKVGDEVLRIVAGRLKMLVGADQCLARLNGDSFGLIQPCAGAAGAKAFAREISAQLSGVVEITGHSIELAVHIGAVRAPADGDSIGLLMQRAEMALYRAKLAGGGDVVLFDPDLEIALRERQALEADLKAAYDLNQFELHYQPIMEYKTRRVASMEALMRWRHPERGLVPPGIFIPIAEETGLIGKLGEWALHRACKDALDWPEHVGVAVNLSAAQFQTGDICAIAAAALEESGLEPKRLELEVTESLLLRDEARTRGALKRLQGMGIHIALDDFGTGYASLSYLRSFPFDKIKIDQTFIRDLPRDADCNAIVHSVVALARMLGMRTVAEGIETAQHLEMVVAAGCDEIQGYYLSRPVPADAAVGVIADCEQRLAEAA